MPLQTEKFFGRISCAAMCRMGVMPTVTEKRNDPPPDGKASKAVSVQDISRIFFHFSLEESLFSLLFICKIVVENVYVNLNETSPMLL